MRILGLSCFYHDAAACLVEDGRIVAAAEEERFTRQKHDSSFPTNAVRYCLAEGGVEAGGTIDAVAFYDKPLLKFQRIVETYFAIVPAGLRSFLQAMPVWTNEKLWTEPAIRDALGAMKINFTDPIHFLEHHESHAASAFYPSPFQDAAILTLDGVGEWATAVVGVGRGENIEILKELDFPHSLGLLYSAFTYFTGFRVNSGEYKLMGLAPYGEGRYTKLILDKLLDLKDDGSFRLNIDYFGYLSGLTMTNDRFAELFGGPARSPESPITQRERDLAKSVQEVTEEIVLRMAREARKTTGLSKLCLAGGVALNCVANGRLLRERIVDDFWVQPAAGDSGAAIGAALRVWHGVKKQPRKADGKRDSMQGALLGPEFPDDEVRAFLQSKGYAFEEFQGDAWADRIASLIADEKVVALCQGRMEFGPRALGNRSIIGDARSPKMQSAMNLKVKFRESFRPFAPAVLEERVSEYFEIDHESPYMLLVAPVRESRRVKTDGDAETTNLNEWVNRPRSDIPAVTHVDYSARIQTVSAETNPRFHAVLKAFEKRTGYGLVINTSFNVRGEPIVCTPEDAYRCFMRSAIDYLVLGSFILDRQVQPVWHDVGGGPAFLD
jgi:carbamoyltransferase